MIPLPGFVKEMSVWGVPEIINEAKCIDIFEYFSVG